MAFLMISRLTSGEVMTLKPCLVLLMNLCLQKFPFVYLLYESAVDSGYSTYVKHIVWHMTEKKLNYLNLVVDVLTTILAVIEISLDV